MKNNREKTYTERYNGSLKNRIKKDIILLLFGRLKNNNLRNSNQNIDNSIHSPSINIKRFSDMKFSIANKNGSLIIILNP